MSSDDIFASPYSLLDEAKECVDHVERLQRAYIGSNAIREVRYENPESGFEVVALRLVDAIPPRLSAKASGAINNLRHALDQGLWQSIRATSGEPAKDTYFPFAESIPDLNGRLRQLEGLGLHPDISDVIRKHKPWKRGKDTPDANVVLRAVGSFAATKHRENLGVNVNSNSIHAKFMASSGHVPCMGIGSWDRGNNEIKLGEVGAGGDIKYKIEIPFYVCINRIDDLDGVPLLPFLVEALKQVRALADELKAETIRITK